MPIPCIQPSWQICRVSGSCTKLYWDLSAQTVYFFLHYLLPCTLNLATLVLTNFHQQVQFPVLGFCIHNSLCLGCCSSELWRIGSVEKWSHLSTVTQDSRCLWCPCHVPSLYLLNFHWPNKMHLHFSSCGLWYKLCLLAGHHGNAGEMNSSCH